MGYMSVMEIGNSPDESDNNTLERILSTPRPGTNSVIIHIMPQLLRHTNLWIPRPRTATPAAISSPCGTPAALAEGPALAEAIEICHDALLFVIAVHTFPYLKNLCLKSLLALVP